MIQTPVNLFQPAPQPSRPTSNDHIITPEKLEQDQHNSGFASWAIREALMAIEGNYHTTIDLINYTIQRASGAYLEGFALAQLASGGKLTINNPPCGDQKWLGLLSEIKFNYECYVNRFINNTMPVFSPNIKGVPVLDTDSPKDLLRKKLLTLTPREIPEFTQIDASGNKKYTPEASICSLSILSNAKWAINLALDTREKKYHITVDLKEYTLRHANGNYLYGLALAEKISAGGITIINPPCTEQQWHEIKNDVLGDYTSYINRYIEEISSIKAPRTVITYADIVKEHLMNLCLEPSSSSPSNRSQR